jgi:hypothetical protein
VVTLGSTSTSFRLSAEAKERLASRAARDRISATSLLERLITEGIDALDHPGIVHRGPANDRRAALAGGPDVWEVVDRLQQLEGSLEQRVETLAAESGLHPRQVRVAVDYAAAHADEVQARIRENERAIEASRRATAARDALFT